MKNPRGICSVCGRSVALYDDGQVWIHEADKRKRPWPKVGNLCKGSDELPSSTGMQLPERWDDYAFPKWVPNELRVQLREFWCESFGRSPKDWLKSPGDAYSKQIPLGTRVACKSSGVCSGSKRRHVGRWVPMWNNIGRLVLRNGRVLYYATHDILNHPKDSK